MSNPDQKYINALLTNDLVTLDELYKRFSGRIRHMVLQNQGSETDAADIFQDALLTIFNKARTGNFVLTCPFEAFLYSISKRKWLKELSKRRKNKVTIVDEREYSIGEDCFKLVEECQLYESRRTLLFQKWTELGEGCKKLLQLSWTGISMGQVAGIMKVTYGYARKKKSTCMEELIRLMKQSDQYNLLKK